MKVYIFADMEGISGVSGSEFVSAGGAMYNAARHFYTWDMNACARGCFSAGAEAVLVRDGHGGGRHALWEELDERIELIQGDSGSRRMPGLDECGALILLGYHAMAGTRGALLEHSYSSASIQNLWLNGQPVGEIGIDAGIAGDRGIPTILVTGDDFACREAEVWIPGVLTCQVKTALSCQGARLLPRAEAHRRLEAAAAEAVLRVGTIPPPEIDRPVTIRQEVVERGRIPSDFARPDVTIIDGRTYEVTADTVEEAFFAL